MIFHYKRGVNKKENKKTWLAQNYQAFRYAGSGVVAPKSKKYGTRVHPRYLEQGFLNQKRV